jgi:hypothetical protein
VNRNKRLDKYASGVGSFVLGASAAFRSSKVSCVMLSTFVFTYLFFHVDAAARLQSFTRILDQPALSTLRFLVWRFLQRGFIFNLSVLRKKGVGTKCLLLQQKQKFANKQTAEYVCKATRANNE